MFNFEWSNQTLFYGLYDRINSVWENTEMAATGTPTPEELALLQPLVDEGLLARHHPDRRGGDGPDLERRPPAGPQEPARGLGPAG